MTAPALTFTSAASLARSIRAGEVSSTEVVEAHLQRIDAVNPVLNAVVQLLAEPARLRARAADAALARGELWGPLHGVPFTIKDWIDVAGVPCTGGMPEHAQRVPVADATVVTRLKAAGGILLGKTNVAIDNAVYGRTNNPYNPAYSPAGSSSGEAALIAAGGSPFGLGSDSGGSIRQPAHCCGIAGLKPTNGRVPTTGHFPYISALNDPRTVIGPLARHVEDLALVLPVIAGEDWRDASVVPMPLGDMDEVTLSGLRAAWYTNHAGADPTPETIATVQAAARALADAGIQVEQALPGRIDEALAITLDYWRRPESESLDEWAPESGFDPEHLGPMTAEDVERSLFQWDRFQRALIQFMGRYDLILTPAAEAPARPHGEPEGGIPYTLPYSLTGYPCVVVRAGTSPDGMPIGVQLVARPWRDHVALAAARHLEQALGGWQPPTM
jgi:amidase